MSESELQRTGTDGSAYSIEPLRPAERNSRHLNTVPIPPDIVDLTYVIPEASYDDDFKNNVSGWLNSAKTEDPKQPEIIRQPDYTYNFDQAKLLGSGAIQPTDASRLRAVVQALAREVPDYKDANAGLVEAKITRFKEYLSYKPEISGVAEKDKKIRGVLVSLENELSELKSGLEETNEPSWQAIQQLKSEYKGLILEKDLNYLELIMLCGLHGDKLTQSIDAKIHEIQKAAKLAHRNSLSRL